MGYEIVFHYAEQTDGEYDRENIKTKKVKVGSPYEEAGLELVAGKIMAQLARRAILVTDVEVFEYTKKAISYKETPVGIKLKNKVFRFEDGAVLTTSEEEEEKTDSRQQLIDLLQSNPQLSQYLNGKKEVANNKNIVVSNDKILRHEYYMPDKVLAKETAKRGYRLTYGKQYPIFEEKTVPSKLGEQRGVGSTIFYIIMDDTGKKVSLHNSLFSPTSGVLKYNEDEPTASNGDIDLDWGNSINENIPNIRG